jgi:hypothetical protein
LDTCLYCSHYLDQLLSLFLVHPRTPLIAFVGYARLMQHLV